MNQKMKMNASGQAAVTDALFLLVIVTALTAFMVLFATSYGTSIGGQVTKNFNSSYVTSALKTLMYTSAPRFGDEITFSPNEEVDYLMAIVKEDYADGQGLTPKTKKVLAKTVDELMGGLSDSYDYMFTIRTSDKFVMLMIHRTEFQNVEFGKRNVKLTATGHQTYFCNTGSSEIPFEQIQKLMVGVGDTYSAENLVVMVQANNQSLSFSQPELRAVANLTMWIATPVEDSLWNSLNCTAQS